MLGQAAEILGMPTDRLKNWTNGRPFRILPSVQAKGAGSRNLYSQRDLYRFAIAKQLSVSGLTPVAIQRVLDNPGPDVTTVHAVVVTASGWPQGIKRRTSEESSRERGDLTVHSIRESPDHHTIWESLRALIFQSLGSYVLQVREIIQMIDERVEQFHTAG
jgi:hypothetical protein